MAWRGAQFMQHDYYQVTRRFLPVIEMDLAGAAGNLFVYDPAQQVVATSQVTAPAAIASQRSSATPGH